MLRKFISVFIITLSCIMPMVSTAAPTKEKETVHVFFFQFGTQVNVYLKSVLLQLPKSTPKIVMGNFPKDMKKEYNVQTFSVPYEAGWRYNRGYDLEKLQPVINTMKKRSANYIFHAATNEPKIYFPFLQQLPADRIKHLNLYDETTGIFYNNSAYRDSRFSPEQLKTCIDYYCIATYKHAYQFSLHQLYPTTYHTGFLPILKADPEFKDFWEYTKTARWEDMNFHKLAETMPESAKQALYKLYDFDKEDYVKQTEGKLVHMFIIGNATDKKKDKEKLLNQIRDWISRYEDPNAILFVKLGKRSNITKEIQEAHLPVSILPKKISFEVLTIANLIPDSVSGTPSALYRNLPKESIGFIYGDDGHNRSMEKLGLLKKSQIITDI